MEYSVLFALNSDFSPSSLVFINDTELIAVSFLESLKKLAVGYLIWQTPGLSSFFQNQL